MLQGSPESWYDGAVLPFETLDGLAALAQRLGVTVRMEPFDLAVIVGRGGLCWLRGRPMVVIDAGLPVLDKIAVLAGALGRFDLDAVYMQPALRARIEREQDRSARAASFAQASLPSNVIPLRRARRR